MAVVAIVVTATCAPSTSLDGGIRLNAIDEERTVAFSMILQTERTDYEPWADIPIEAKLAFLGPEPRRVLDCPPRPVMFGIRQLDGDLSIGDPEAWPLMCPLTELERGESMTFPYSADGHHYPMDDPRADLYARMLSGLPCCVRLPTGLWEVSAWSWAGATTELNASKDPRLTATLVIRVHPSR